MVMIARVYLQWNLPGAVNQDFQSRKDFAQFPLWLSNFSKQILLETKSMSKFVPDVVVSDSRLSPLFSSRILLRPSIVILNQIKLLLSPRLRQFWGARAFEKLTGEWMGLLWSVLLTEYWFLIFRHPIPYRNVTFGIVMSHQEKLNM